MKTDFFSFSTLHEKINLAIKISKDALLCKLINKARVKNAVSKIVDLFLWLFSSTPFVAVKGGIIWHWVIKSVKTAKSSVTLIVLLQHGKSTNIKFCQLVSGLSRNIIVFRYKQFSCDIQCALFHKLYTADDSWTINGERTKQKMFHTSPLPLIALKLLEY